jgi:hypothetical protein
MDDFSGYYGEVLAGFSNWLTSPHANEYMVYMYILCGEMALFELSHIVLVILGLPT